MTNSISAFDLVRLHQSTRGLSEEQLCEIADRAVVVQFQPGEIVHRAGTIDQLLLISRGSLRVTTSDSDGDPKTIFYVGRDDQVGLLSLSQTTNVLPVTVIAEETATAIRISRDAAESLLQDIPIWRRNLMRSLGPQIREKFLGERQQRKPRFVVLIHASDQTRDITTTLTRRLIALGEKVGLLSDRSTTLTAAPSRSASITESGGQLLSPHAVRDQLAAWHDAERVLVDVKLTDSVSARLSDFMAGCQAAYWFCPTGSTESVVQVLMPLVQTSPGIQQKTSVVQVLGIDEQVAEHSLELNRVCRQVFKLHLKGCRVDSLACSQRAGIERLVHHLRGISIGLALGGGAARGMAHLGVLQVLEDADIIIDRLSGTSAGALTGIPYSAGYSVDYIVRSFAHDLTPGWFFKLLPYGDAAYMFWKYRSGAWDGMLRQHLRSWRLEQLTLPFSSVAVDLISAEVVIRREYDAAQAVLESINLPGIARPICRDGQALVDGGVLNVVPADVLVDQEADFVIASDVAAKISFEFAGNRSDTPTEKMKVPSGSAAALRARTVQDRNIRSIGGSAADIVIEPDVADVALTDFQHAAEIAMIGRHAAEAALPELRRRLHQKDPQLFTC